MQWEGTHKWICPSPYRPNHGRKNWLAGVWIFNAPELPSWSEDELRIDTMRSSGPGGQHVNKTSSAVWITHTPTGLCVTATEERSQHRNRKLALARLARLFEGAAEKTMDSKQTELWLQHWHLERGNEVRTYKGPKFKLSPPKND